MSDQSAKSQRPYFIWDYDLTEEDVRKNFERLRFRWPRNRELWVTPWNGGRKMRKPLHWPTMQAFFITIANGMMDRLRPELT